MCVSPNLRALCPSLCTVDYILICSFYEKKNVSVVACDTAVTQTEIRQITDCGKMLMNGLS